MPVRKNRGTGLRIFTRAMKSLTQYLSAILMITATVLNQGCVAQKGVDFGHWAMTAERRQLVRVTVEQEAWLSSSSTIAILPLVGKMSGTNSERFRQQLGLNLQDQIPLNLITPSEEIADSPLLQEDNLIRGGNPRISEIAGAGKIFEASHALCIWITEFNPYPPQKIYFQAWLIKTSDSSLCASITSSLDAAEQQTILAAAAYMQSRRARPYNETNLDILLQSPMEFSDFVCYYSSRHIALQMIVNGLIPGPIRIAQKGMPAK